MAVDIIVPPLSQTMDTVHLVGWLKGVGDRVEKGEPLFVIETDKANLDIEAPASGVLQQVFAEPGAEVKVRSAIGESGLRDASFTYRHLDGRRLRQRGTVFQVVIEPRIRRGCSIRANAVVDAGGEDLARRDAA